MHGEDGRVSFVHVPDEILLLVLSFVDDVFDMMNMRKVCRRFNSLATEKSLWLSLYHSQSYDLPIPYSGSFLTERSNELTHSHVESLVLSIHLTECRWLSARGYPRFLYTGNKDMEVVDTGYFGTILSTDILLSRWLVVVHQEGMLALWDLFPNAQGLACDYGVGLKWTSQSITTCRFKTELRGLGSCTSSAICMDASQNAIVLAVSSQNLTRVVRLNLDPAMPPMDSLATLPTPASAYRVNTIDPSSHIIVFSHSSSLRCLHWSSCRLWNVVLSEEADEELWNGVVGIKYLTPRHIICVKTRSVELHLLPSSIETQHTDDATAPSVADPIILEHNVIETRVVRRRFGEMTFRGVSFSEPQIVASPEGTVATVAFLAYDVLRGLFHYEVQAQLSDSDASPTSTPMDLSVRLLAAHRMAQLVSTAALLGTDTPTPRSMFSAGARGFVSACVLGPQGRRGVWIERQRGNMDRTVFGFRSTRTRGREPVGTRGDEGGDPGTAPALDGVCLHEVRNSYDLGEDLTHCAFSELTGKVVIGNRRGQLFVL